MATDRLSRRVGSVQHGHDGHGAAVDRAGVGRRSDGIRARARARARARSRPRGRVSAGSLRRVSPPGHSAAARISDSASVTRARMFERIVSRPAQTAFVAFEMEDSCDLS